MRQKCHQSAVSLRLCCWWRVWVITINCRLQALSLHIILRSFRRVYKQRDLYRRGLITEIEKALLNQASKHHDKAFSPQYSWREGVGGGRGGLQLLSLGLEKCKKNAIFFKLFCYRIFLHWELKLLNFLMDSVLIFFVFRSNMGL